MNSAGSDKNKEQYYAFISYKHKDGEYFIEDSYWAKKLKQELELISIKTPPIEEKDILDNDIETISQVFRDNDSLSAGEFPEAIKKALNHSRVLVVIVSKEMVNKENECITTDREDKAWVNKEIKDFISKDNISIKDFISKKTLDEAIKNRIAKICLVNIEKDKLDQNGLEEIIPTVLKSRFDLSNHRIISPFVDYKENRNKKYFVERTACAIAGFIFGCDPGTFWSYRKKERQ